VSLAKITIRNFRNIAEINLILSQKYNVFFGGNGSGKTSILEAVYYLGVGRSFRSHVLQRIVKQGTDFFTLFGEIQREDEVIPLGIERFNDGDCKIRVAGEDLKSLVDLVKIFPVILMSQDGFELFSGGAKQRRKFIDWGLFHVEPAFMPSWKKANRALLQRNALLKTMRSVDDIRIWNNELVAAGVILHGFRERYVADLLPIAANLIKVLVGDFDISLNYCPGWNISKDLSDILAENLNSDRKTGFTQYGPHRADLKFQINNVPVQHVLSRGQQKLLFFALHLAQGILLAEKTNKQCVYLIDDLAAELDAERKRIMINVLDGLGAQVFLTSLGEMDLRQLSQESVKLFHVEQGAIVSSD
jgi:DNA replication and repair protein RecF